MNQLNLSIDLESELSKITRKQHLNSVHYPVQLIRHALTHHPAQIHIFAKERYLEIQQNGDLFNQHEWTALQRLLTQGKVAIRQNALATLEQQHGIAILSIIMNHPEVTIESGNHCLESFKGKISYRQNKEYVRGYRISIQRSTTRLREEKNELSFYCSTCDTPIFVNGKKLNQTIAFPNQILITEFQNHFGQGAVGLPDRSDLCVITFYKKGIRLGMKQFVPNDGMVFHGYWNIADPTFESDYRGSIRDGDRFLIQHRDLLYRQIKHYFASLDPHQKGRIKQILMGIDVPDWRQRFSNIPIFQGPDGPFSHDLANLLALERRFEGIPYRTQVAPKGPEFIPILGLDDLHFLRERLGLQLRLVNGKKGNAINGRRSWFRKWKASPDVLEKDQLGSEWHQFLRALNQDDPVTSFHGTQAPSQVRLGDWDLREVYLNVADPQCRDFLGKFLQNPNQLPRIKYQLLHYLGMGKRLRGGKPSSLLT